MYCKSAFAFAAVLSLGSVAMAQSDQQEKGPQEKPIEVEVKPLTIGDPARPIDIQHWVKGDKVATFEDGKVYVVEFWATWCAPCLASMPHITEVQERYKDYGVTFIGVSDEELQTVVKFLCKADKEGKLWNDKIGYTLTTDPDRSVYESYMSGVGAMGIPTAFIVGKDTKLEWVGHPMGIDKPLEAVVKDEWDREAFAAEFEPKAQKNREQLAKMKAERGKTKPHQDALKKAIADKDLAAATKALDALIVINPDPMGPKMQKFQVMLKDFDAPWEAYAIGIEIMKECWENPMMLNALAWFVVDTAGIKSRDLDFAHQLATQANDLTKGEDAAIIDTLARVYFEKGDLKKAIEWQKKAVAHSEDGPMGEELAETLKKYEEAAANKGNR